MIMIVAFPQEVKFLANELGQPSGVVCWKHFNLLQKLDPATPHEQQVKEYTENKGSNKAVQEAEELYDAAEPMPFALPGSVTKRNSQRSSSGQIRTPNRIILGVVLEYCIQYDLMDCASIYPR